MVGIRPWNEHEARSLQEINSQDIIAEGGDR